jgi:hypothetical protein
MKVFGHRKRHDELACRYGRISADHRAIADSWRRQLIGHFRSFWTLLPAAVGYPIENAYHSTKDDLRAFQQLLRRKAFYSPEAGYEVSNYN